MDPALATTAVDRVIGKATGMTPEVAAAGISEIVTENMANAARVHAIENGKETAERTLIAFGGAAPLQATRLAGKLGIDRIIVPSGAGVGSAVGFLRAPIAYEVVRTRYLPLKGLDVAMVNALFARDADGSGSGRPPRRTVGAADRNAHDLHALSRPGA